jgi:integrase
MKGYMRARSGGWELRVYAGRDAATGRKRYLTRTVRGGKREAQRVLAALVVEAAEIGAPRQGTVAELMNEWLAHAERDFSPKTALETRRFIDRALAPRIGDRPLTKLRPRDLDVLYRELSSCGGRDGRPLAPATVRRIHGIIHRALAQGVRWGWIAKNPAEQATPPRVPTPRIQPPSPDQVTRLIDVAAEKDPRLATFVMLAAVTGARRSELLALRWSDLDLDRGVVDIARGVVLGRDGVVEKETKSHTTRRVALDQTAVQLLVGHRRRVEHAAHLCGTGFPESRYVFSHEPDGSRPWRPDAVTHSFVRLRTKAGLPSVRLHDLRHFVATRLLSSGVDVRTVAGRLGHRNAATTLNVYSHFLVEADREAADLIGRLVGASGVSRPLESGAANAVGGDVLEGHGEQALSSSPGQYSTDEVGVQ